jgi:hypothetical protein
MPRTYDDKRRVEDYGDLASKTPEQMMLDSALLMHGALCVFLLDPLLRPLLEVVDPKAVQQARKAVGLSD